MSGTTLFNTRHVSNSAAGDYWRGLGTIMNIRGNTHREYKFAHSEQEADEAAIADDWRVVGEDLFAAIERCPYGRR
ncbi:hypothetical protein GCM10023065_22250 [Microbacterium laevaniformans]|uniref:hypothetical protein n=1 Tax=Microbacterium laevaniformans TaxID=36807 RepID=UPI00195E2ED8|nr:hypothetical protein [Microbacterium laevaniformans]MBM7753183.1 hypothetical protein [Microbacterium laevaniformans]GLJ65299.1 hypothetical protein GCM10017578_21880 [Microbacterium laevaniformans]